jgi:phosphatidate cytidylyltransferase
MIIGLVLLVLLIPSIFDKKGEYTTKEAFYLAGTTIGIGLFFNLVMLVYNFNRWELLYLLAIATMTDTFAMLIGCLIGKHKLIPEVSPKKSIEGSIAGSIVGTAIASIYYINILDTNINLIVLLVMSLILSILGQIGDLFFSKMKRENEIKDFSNLMPGHGGILDRFDSLSFIIFGYIVIFHILSII